jgi:hypothetical protein
MKLQRNGIFWYLVFDVTMDAWEWYETHDMYNQGCYIVCYDGYENAISFPEG